MKWLRVQRNTSDSLFKDPQRVLIVLVKVMRTGGKSWQHFWQYKQPLQGCDQNSGNVR